MSVSLNETKRKLLKEIQDKLLSEGDIETNPIATMYFFENDEKSPYETRRDYVGKLINTIEQEYLKGKKCSVEIHYIAGGKATTTILTMSMSN